MYDLNVPESGGQAILKPGLNKVSVSLTLTKDNDIVINFKKNKEVKVAFWLNDSESKDFTDFTTSSGNVITADFKKKMYEHSVVNALRQVFNALVKNETDWLAMSNTVQSTSLTMPELFQTIKSYLEENYPEYWKHQVYVALSQYKNNLKVACFQQNIESGKWFVDSSYRSKFISDEPFEVPYFQDFQNDEISLEEGNNQPVTNTEDW